MLGNETGGTAGLVRMNVASAVRSLPPPWRVCLQQPAPPGLCLQPSRRGRPQRLKDPCHKVLQPPPRYQHPPLRWGKTERTAAK